MANGAADDAAQHIAAPFIAGNHAIGNQEGTGSNMIGQHAQGRSIGIRTIRLTHGRLDQALKKINLVVGMHMLQDR